MNVIRGKWKKKTGFTLAETLIAILILLMVSAIVAGALPMAARVFTKTVDTANAQVLLSTTMTALRDELSTAADISASGTTITYRNASNGYCQLEVVSTPTDDKKECGIWLSFLDYDPATGKTTVKEGNPSRLLVSAKASTTGEPNNLRVAYDNNPSITDDAVVFSNLKVYINDVPSSTASRASFTIRRIAKVEVAPTPAPQETDT